MKAKRAKRRKLTPEEKLERARAKTTAAMVEAAPSVEAAGIVKSKTSGESHRMLRHQGMIDYVTDPDCRSLEHHYHRRDRQYPKHISEKKFRKWSSADGWVERREKFWEEISVKVLEHQQEALLAQQQRETEQLLELRGHVLEHLSPLLGEDGAIQRYPMEDRQGEKHPLGGKPILPYRIESYDKALKMFIDLEKQVMLKRGEVTKRVEHASDTGDGGSVSALDPVTRRVAFTPEEVRAMARKVLLMRQPELELLGPDLTDGGGASQNAGEEPI